MQDISCPYCVAKAELKDSAIIYNGRSYGKVYVCSNYPTCDAYCGVHKGTDVPLGRLANAELREGKKRAHAVFDPLWKTGVVSRKGAYAIASEIMGKPVDETHIGMFDVQECKDLIAGLRLLPNNTNSLLKS
jgi:ssDNA-binding Zn-finger/Zn-ribbon topoisomerase 1